MPPGLASVLIVLGVAIVLFALDRPRMDAVALLVVCALPLTGVIEMNEALLGFSDPNIVLIAALFVIGEGLVRTGVARSVGDWLVARTGSSPTRLIVLLMTVVCVLGATMSSTAVTAIFIPVVLRICRRTGTSPGQLMMPLSAAGLISGMMTLIATAPNLVVHSELVRRGHPGFHFFAFTPFGVPILALCIGYMLFARRWLPATNHLPGTGLTGRPTLSEWVVRYKLADREQRLRVAPGSALVGRTLETLGLRGSSGANLIAIQRDRTLLQPTAKTVLRAGDVLFVDLFGSQADVEAMRQQYALTPLPITGAHFTDHAQEIGMAEMIVPADSELIGKTIVEAGIRTRFGFSVIGLRRGVEAIEENLMDEKLRIGDTLLVIGPWKALRNVSVSAGGPRDLLALSLPAEFDDVLPADGKAPHALAVLLLVVTGMVLGLAPNVQIVLLGCLLMGLLGCIDLESAYRAISWKTIVLIVGMLPFSIALERTGGVDLASQALMSLTSGMGPRAVLAALFALTALLSLFISNTATAVLVAPVALSVAEHLGVSPYPFAMTVALAASAAFMTPISSPVNTLVVTPGGYRFGDFVRVGVPFTCVVLIVTIVLVPWLLPF
jgi:di/tricarboxylate transporter